MDYLGSLDSSRSLQTRYVISFVISLHLILQMLKIPFQKSKNPKYKIFVNHLYGVLNVVKK